MSITLVMYKSSSFPSAPVSGTCFLRRWARGGKREEGCSHGYHQELFKGAKPIRSVSPFSCLSSWLPPHSTWTHPLALIQGSPFGPLLVQCSLTLAPVPPMPFPSTLSKADPPLTPPTATGSCVQYLPGSAFWGGRVLPTISSQGDSAILSSSLHWAATSSLTEEELQFPKGESNIYRSSRSPIPGGVYRTQRVLDKRAFKWTKRNGGRGQQQSRALPLRH